MIKLPDTINDIHSAGREWLRLKLKEEEKDLPDYDRPLKEIKEVGKTEFGKQVSKWGLLRAIIKNVTP